MASDDQRERFCTREHSREHGSGSANGDMGQGVLGAPWTAALIASGTSRFAALLKSDEKPSQKNSNLADHLLRLGRVGPHKNLLRPSISSAFYGQTAAEMLPPP